jgi:hypothetical protein
MIEMLLSFVGGGAFRAIFEGVLGYVNKAQDHKHEMDRLERQWQIEQKKAEIAAEVAKIEADGKLAQLSAEYAGKAEIADIDLLTRTLEATSKPAGIPWVDAMNGTVRPVTTYTLLLCYMWYRVTTGAAYDPTVDGALLGSVLGFWFADRSLRKMGGK